MKKSAFAPVVLALSLLLAGGAARADVLADCYKAAENRVQVRQCLQKELEATQREYQAVLNRLSEDMALLDQAQGAAPKKKSKGAKKGGLSQSLSDSNQTFDAYMKRQCAFEAAATGTGTGAGNQQIACKITLMRLRMGALSSFIPADAPASSGH